MSETQKRGVFLENARAVYWFRVSDGGKPAGIRSPLAAGEQCHQLSGAVPW